MSCSETADSGVGRCEIFRHRGDVSVALTAAEDLRFGVVFDVSTAWWAAALVKCLSSWLR